MAQEGSQVWGIDAQGGFMYSDELSDTLRTALQPMVRFRQFCDARDATEKGLHSGEEYNWNIYSDVETQGTDLVEYTGTGATTALEPMPETYYTISQGSLTVTEKGKLLLPLSKFSKFMNKFCSVVIGFPMVQAA